MATIDELIPEQIRVPETFQKIKELGDSFILRMQTKEAYFLQEKLTALLKISNLSTFNPELYKNYQDLLVLLKWTAFPILPDEEVLEILNAHYLAVLDNENIDVQDRIEAKMFTKDLFPRNELKQKMQKALRENKERLGNEAFGEWLLDYNKTFDFRERDELAHLRYMRQNPAVQVLSEPEKNKLRKALQIFDKTLLATPVMSEPLLSMAVRAMIKGGIIGKEEINPALLQPSPFLEVTPKTPIPTPAKPIAKEVKKIPETEKFKKPGLFKKLFGKKPEKPKKPKKLKLPKLPKKKKEPKKEPEPEEILPPKIEEAARRLKKIPSIYEGKISPYEKKRELEQKREPIHIGRLIPPSPEPPEPPLEKVIPTFPAAPRPIPKAPPPPVEKPSAIPAGKYHIRTMKKDVEMARQSLPRPEAKVRDNIVDLSGNR